MPNLSNSTTLDYTSSNTTPVIEGDACWLTSNSDGTSRVCIRYAGMKSDGSPGVAKDGTDITDGFLKANTLFAYPASNFGNATAADVLSGKTFTSTAGVKVNGTIPTKGATTHTPGTSNKTAVAAGTYCSGAQTVKGDSNLKADNIKKGVSIFGVTGTLDATPGVIRKDLLSYTDISVTTSSVTKTLGPGACVGIFEIIKFDGNTVNPADYVQYHSTILNNFYPTSTSAITLKLNPITEYNYDTYQSTNHPYTVRVYYYPDTVVGCIKYKQTDDKEGTIEAINNNTFSMAVFIGNNSYYWHSTVGCMNMIRDSYDYIVFRVFRTYSGIYMEYAGNRGATLYSYYFK
jgi:hypothetical protein